MSAHAWYVTAAYGVSAAALFGLIGFILFDQYRLRRQVDELEAAGVKRRSEKAAQNEGGTA